VNSYVITVVCPDGTDVSVTVPLNPAQARGLWRVAAAVDRATPGGGGPRIVVDPAVPVSDNDTKDMA